MPVANERLAMSGGRHALAPFHARQQVSSAAKRSRGPACATSAELLGAHTPPFSRARDRGLTMNMPTVSESAGE